MNEQVLEEYEETYLDEDNAVPIDCAKKLAFERMEVLQKESEIEDDVTLIFYKALRQKLIKGETIITSIMGQTRKGKSVIGLHILNAINDIIVDLDLENSILRGKEEEWEINLEKQRIRPIELLAGSRNEFNRIAKRTELKGIATLCDEDASLDSTGMDGTTETALTDYFLRVCAESNIHMIACAGQGKKSPYDDYATFLIRIVDVDKDKKITKAKLYYNIGEEASIVFLGYITLDVSDIIGGNGNEEKAWYKDYSTQKTLLINYGKRGIKGSKDLELTFTAYLCYRAMINYVRIGGYGNHAKNLIRTKLEKITREMDGCHSIVSIEFLVKKVDGLLGLRDAVRIKEYQLENYWRAKVPKEKLLDYKEELEKQLKILKEELRQTLEDQKEIIKLYIDYRSIGNHSQKGFIKGLCKRYGINLEGDDKDE